MAPPPELIDDVVSEILLHLPPDEPEHLFRASLVCKSWFRLLTDPDFLRRYRAFHRTPPLLGYLERRQFRDGDPKARLVPTTSVSLAPDPYFCRASRALDCHHGRVLLRAYDDDWHWHHVVWDPVTGERKRVPEPGMDCIFFSAAVCCAVSGCDHLECHSGPFRVAIIASDGRAHVKACVYSSETGAWSTPATLGNSEIYVQWGQDALRFQPKPGAIIEEEIYFTICGPGAIIRYDMRKSCLSTIDPPSQDDFDIALMEMEDSTLGFVYIRGSSLYLWSRKVNSEAAEWVQCKVVELGKRIPVVSKFNNEAVVVGAAEGVGVIFVGTGAGLFTINVNSGQIKKIGKGKPEVFLSILPFMSFYTLTVAKSSLARPRTRWFQMCPSTKRHFQVDESTILSLLSLSFSGAINICFIFC